jgi:hypothetical protein
MKANTGDRYQCTDPDCGCEVEIVTPCSADMEEVDEDSNPSCFCGAGMQRSERSSAAPA